MARALRISLANKCQILFGAAVLLILAAALSVVWLRMQSLVRQEQTETARSLAGAWLNDMIQLGGALVRTDQLNENAERSDQPLALTLVRKDEFQLAAQRDPFLAATIARFQRHEDEHEATDYTSASRGQPRFRYARAIRRADLAKLRGGAEAGFAANVDVPGIANPLEMILLIQVYSDLAQRQLMVNRVYIVLAGVFAGLLAIGVFYYITKRIILSPVRVLRDTAEQVSSGQLNSRCDINTGDEFERLSDVFNQMLDNLQRNQDQLRSVNKSLDLRLGELAQTNVALYEANKIKGEFLANVSHELRTPLNSIVGFAELLQESLKQMAGDADDKRRRYAVNIIQSSRRLLDLITDLLDLAKIEAGRMELRVGPMSVSDAVEGLLTLIRPQAEKKKLTLNTKLDKNLPLVQTDAGKFQQVLFNFLSNALKFTPEGGSVTVTARHLPGDNGAAKVRISVTDTGPGIAPENHARVFEKFTQLDAGVTREHQGTGLGLTISRELAHLLQGEVDLASQLGQGATFSLTIPVNLTSRTGVMTPELTRE